MLLFEFLLADRLVFVLELLRYVDIVVGPTAGRVCVEQLIETELDGWPGHGIVVGGSSLGRNGGVEAFTVSR